MATQFLFRPLNFEWKQEIFKNRTSESLALSKDNYVDELMMKLPAFPRSNSSTLVIETGYATPEARANLAEEAFLGSLESRTLVVHSPNYVRGGALMNPAAFAATGNSSGAGSSRSTTPVKMGLNAVMDLRNRLAIPHSPQRVHNNQDLQQQLLDQSSQQLVLDISSTAAGSTLASAARKSTAILLALEHRRRMRADETFFGMIAFSALSRPPIDLVAPFRMGATNPNEHIAGKVAPENYRLTLAEIKHDEDLLRLYEEISSSTSFREAASKLSILCFITATPPTEARHSWNQSCACSLQQLLTSSSSGTDVLLLLQPDHHLSAMPCLGIDTNSKIRRPDKSDIPQEVKRDYEQWCHDRDRALRSSSSTSSSSTIASMKLPYAAEILKCISSCVGVRGDSAVVSRLTSEDLSTDTFGLWKLVSDVEKEIASRGSATDHPSSNCFGRS
jgi:hypothetical protein